MIYVVSFHKPKEGQIASFVSKVQEVLPDAKHVVYPRIGTVTYEGINQSQLGVIEGLEQESEGTLWNLLIQEGYLEKR